MSELLEQVDAVCDRFEAALKAVSAGEPAPRIEDYLAATSSHAQATLRRELIALDWAYRMQRGEAPQAIDYQARFPELQTESLAELDPRRTGPYIPQAGLEALPLLASGSLLKDRFVIERLLGQGGFGQVYWVTHLHLTGKSSTLFLDSQP